MLEPCIPGFTSVRKLVSSNILDSKLIQQSNYDSSHRSQKFYVLDQVLYKDCSIRPAGSKLKPIFGGPYTVVGVVNDVTYMLCAENSNQCFASHVSKMKKWFPPSSSLPTASSSKVTPASKLTEPRSLGYLSEESSGEEEDIVVTPIRVRRTSIPEVGSDDQQSQWSVMQSSTEESTTDSYGSPSAASTSSSEGVEDPSFSSNSPVLAPTPEPYVAKLRPRR